MTPFTKTVSITALCAALGLSAGSAHAHFLWAKMAPGDKPTVMLGFSEQAEDPTTADLLARIQPARVHIGANALAAKPENGSLCAAVPAPAKVAGAEQTWGVLDRTDQGRGVFLLRYSAKAAATEEAAATAEPLPLELRARREGPVCVVTVYRTEKTVPGAEVTVHTAGQPEDQVLQTDARGEARFAAPASGSCAVRAMAVQQTAGDYEGKHYDFVRDYTTLTFPCATEAKDASSILEGARKLRETWGKEFPGFTSDVEMTVDGRSASGTVKVSADGKVELTMADEQMKDEAQGILRMLVSHRKPEPSGTNKPSFAPADKHPLGTAILLNDGFDSMYRVRDGRILQVNRTMGDSRFTIDVLHTLEVEGGTYLPAVYAVTYRDAKTGSLQRTETFDERYAKVGAYYLPTERIAVTAEQDKTSISTLRLTNTQLTDTATASR